MMTRVIIEPDIGTVRSSVFLFRTDDHRPHHFTFLDRTVGQGAADAYGDDITYAGGIAVGPSEDLDHLHRFRPLLSATFM